MVHFSFLFPSASLMLIDNNLLFEYTTQHILSIIQELIPSQNTRKEPNTTISLFLIIEFNIKEVRIRVYER